MAEFERREAAGDNVWTKEFSEEARIRLLAAFDKAIGPTGVIATYDRAQGIVEYLLSFGLAIPVKGDDHLGSIRKAIRSGDDDTVPSVLEASMAVIQTSAFVGMVKLILEQEKVAYKLNQLDLIPFDSLELHEAVIAPTLRLLAGRPDLSDVESAYQKALKEIGNDAGDAITDAARALQAMLTAIGCAGNSIGAQLTHARKKGILAKHDATLGWGIEKIIDWVNADRSEKGDAHKSAASVTTEDAWLAVHVVGALIVRLAEGPRV